MKNTLCPSTASAVGIDVAKATLSVCFRSGKGAERALTLRNIEADIKRKLLPHLLDYKGKIVMESTGHYHWLPMLVLKEAGLDVRIVNPLLAKQYTTGNIRKVKTDPADAASLARMAEVADNLPPSFSLSKEKLYARKKLAVIGSMSHQLQALSASLKSLKEANGILGINDSPAEEEIEKAVSTLRRSLAHLEREFTADSRKSDEASVSLLSGIPRVSDFCAAMAIHWFNPSLETTPKAWIAYAGLDISSRESGTWRGQCHLTKRGNNYLRSRLFSAAWGAVMNDDNMKTYYDSLKEQGRSHVEALVIIARKIVRMMFMILQTKHVYDPSLIQRLLPVSLIAA